MTDGVSSGSDSASASARVNGRAILNEDSPLTSRKGEPPKLTRSRLVPKDSMLDVISACMPRPIDIRVTTEATPMTMPKSASAARRRLTPRELTAVLKMAGTFNSALLPCQTVVRHAPIFHRDDALRESGHIGVVSDEHHC